MQKRGGVEPISLRDALLRCIHTGNREGRPHWSIPDRGRDVHVKIDEVTLMEILSNLVDNAEKYRAPDSDILYHVRERPYGVAMTVSNLGPQLEEGEDLRIFERQYRGFAARTLVKNGTGMGLYVIKRLCQEYGVEIVYGWRYPGTRGWHHDEMVWHDFTLEIPHGLVLEYSKW
ncbi:MAG: ATP-binding protein [Sphingomonas sp.]